MNGDTDKQILDDTIEYLQGQQRVVEDFSERMKVTDRLLKAIQMRQRMNVKKKGKGFDLGRDTE